MKKRLLTILITLTFIISICGCKSNTNISSSDYLKPDTISNEIENEEINESNEENSNEGESKSQIEQGENDKRKNNSNNNSSNRSKKSSNTSTKNNQSNSTISSEVISSLNKNDIKTITDGSGEELILLNKGFKTEEKKSFTESYLIPPKSETDVSNKGFTTYENSYVKVDLSMATKGYFMLTYKEKYATNVNVTIDIKNAVTDQFENSVHYEYNIEEFSDGKAISVKWPKKEAIYYFSVWSTINGCNSCKFYISVGKVTTDGAVSIDDMIPSEEQIKLVQKSSGVYSNKYLTINTNTSNLGYIDIQYNDTHADEIRLYSFANKNNQKGNKCMWHDYEYPNGKCNIKVPLTYGNTKYTISIFSDMVSDDGYHRYSKKAEIDINVTNVPETAPFLLSTGEVIFNGNMQFIKKANEIASTCKNDFEKVSKIYDWLTSYIDYKVTEDTALTLYKCDLEKVYNKKLGVCYDYAVVLAAMLRSQGIPCKVVFGKYKTSSAGDGHVWNEVYIKSSGSITSSKMSITGNKWCILDPTMSHANASEAALNYMKDRNNYIWEYYY